MALEAKQGIGAVHSAPVVGYPDQADAALLELDGDPPGPRVDGVLDQFLDHRGGSLDHLPGGDLAGQDVGKEADGAHRRANDE